VWEGTNAFTEARTFCELWGVKGTVLVDERGALVEKLGIRGVPTNVFVDVDGTVRAIGASTPRELETAVRELLGPDAPLEEATPSGNWHWETDPERIGEQLSLRGERPGDAGRSDGAGGEAGSAGS
jgi:hypothetical protein